MKFIHFIRISDSFNNSKCNSGFLDLILVNIVMHCLMAVGNNLIRINSEKCVCMPFPCMNIIARTYTKLDGIGQSPDLASM